MNTCNTKNACKRRLAILVLTLIVVVALAGSGETKTVHAQANIYNTYTNIRALNSCPPPGHPEALTPGTDYAGNHGCIDGQGNSYFEDGTQVPNGVPGMNPPQFYQSKLIVSPRLVLEWILKYGILISGFVFVICLVVGVIALWLSAGTEEDRTIFVPRMDGSFEKRREYYHAPGFDIEPSPVLWWACGIGLVVLLSLLGLAFGTGTAGYMTNDLAVNDFCYSINNQDYPAAYDHFSSSIQKSYSEKDFETYLKNKIVKGCNPYHTSANFYNGLQSQGVDFSMIVDPVYGDIRINTFPFGLWNT